MALICTAVLDVFITVLHTQIESRGAVLAWGAPIMIVGIIVFWVSLLVFGLGLLYMPVIHNANFTDPRTGI